MKIQVLIENLTYSQNLKAQHGLSILISEKDKIKILFDTGQNEDFLCNAIYLNESLKDIDYVVLSHGHYDHTGGLESFLRINKKAKIIMSVYAIKEKFSNSTGVIREIGFSLKERYKNFENEFIFITDYYKINDEIEVYSDLKKSNDFEESEGKLYVKEDGNFIPDNFDDELYLVIKKNNKLNIIAGCSHKGIINILTGISNKTGIYDYNYIVGGLHLKGVSEQRMEKTISGLSKINAKMMYINHCTGVNEYMLLKKVLESGVDYFYTGQSIQL